MCKLSFSLEAYSSPSIFHIWDLTVFSLSSQIVVLTMGHFSGPQTLQGTFLHCGERVYFIGLFTLVFLPYCALFLELILLLRSQGIDQGRSD